MSRPEDLKKFGDWSEQQSSGGRIYYYNNITEVSTWSKPKEWIDHEERERAAKEPPPFTPPIPNATMPPIPPHAYMAIPPPPFFPPPGFPGYFLPPPPLNGAAPNYSQSTPMPFTSTVPPPPMCQMPPTPTGRIPHTPSSLSSQSPMSMRIQESPSYSKAPPPPPKMNVVPVPAPQLPVTVPPAVPPPPPLPILPMTPSTSHTASAQSTPTMRPNRPGSGTQRQHNSQSQYKREVSLLADEDHERGAKKSTPAPVYRHDRGNSFEGPPKKMKEDDHRHHSNSQAASRSNSFSTPTVQTPILQSPKTSTVVPPEKEPQAKEEAKEVKKREYTYLPKDFMKFYDADMAKEKIKKLHLDDGERRRELRELIRRGIKLESELSTCLVLKETTSCMADVLRHEKNINEAKMESVKITLAMMEENLSLEVPR